MWWDEAPPPFFHSNAMSEGCCVHLTRFPCPLLDGVSCRHKPKPSFVKSRVDATMKAASTAKALEEEGRILADVLAARTVPAVPLVHPTPPTSSSLGSSHVGTADLSDLVTAALLGADVGGMVPSLVIDDGLSQQGMSPPNTLQHLVTVCFERKGACILATV